MLENDSIFLPILKKNLKSDEELYSFIKASFPDVNSMPVQGSHAAFVFSFFAHVCYPFSVIELSTALGDYIRSTACRVKKNRLVERGALKVYNFSTRDMGAKSAYYLTPQGSDALFEALPSYMCNRTKIRRTGGLLPAHDYGVGISLLQCMLLERPFSYEKELCYSSSLYKDKGSLCVDAVVYFQDDNTTTLYIEQDMGTEPAATLVKKLYSYYRFGLTRNKNKHLIISSHSISDYVSCLSFNVSALKELLADMKEQKADGLYSYYIANKKSFTGRLGSIARALLVRTGICFSVASAGGRIDASALAVNAPISRDTAISDMTISELETYIQALQDGSNAWRIISYNRHQMEVAQKKLRNMADIILRRISLKQYELGEVRCLLEGFSCYVVPSVLMSNHFSHILGEDLADIRYSLSSYFASISTAAFQEQSDVITFSDYPPFLLRNCFILADGSRICVEHIGADLGGYVRAYYFRMLQLAGMGQSIHLVCIYDTEDMAMDFASMLDYYRNNRKLDDDVKISFLLSTDIGERDSLKVPCPLGGGGLIHLKPLFDVPPREKVGAEDVYDSASSETGLENLSIQELNNLLKKI